MNNEEWIVQLWNILEGLKDRNETLNERIKVLEERIDILETKAGML